METVSDAKYSHLSDDDFIKALFRDLLHREADQEGMHHYLRQLREGKQSRSRVINHLLSCTEYRALSGDSVSKKVSENITLNDREIRNGETILSSKPYYFNLDLIGVCNINPPCVMCLDWNGTKGPRHHSGISRKDIEGFGEFIFLAHEIINCSIGEPLLTKDLIPILELLKTWNKPLGINSNGVALSPKLTEQLSPYFEILTIFFSVDGATRDTYGKIRGDRFDQVIENISYYCKKRKELFPGGLASRVGMVMMPMRENRHEVIDFIRLAAKLGVDEVELRSLNEISHDVIVERNNFVFNYREQMLSSEKLESIYREARTIAEEVGILLNCQYEASEEETFDFFLPHRYRDMKVKCTQPWRFFLPYQNGETIGCCYMNRSLGNWREKGLEQLWNSKRMQKIRQQMATGELPDECRLYPSCPIVKSVLSTISKGTEIHVATGSEMIALSALTSGWWNLESDRGKVWIWSKDNPSIRVPSNAKKIDLEFSSDYYNHANAPVVVLIADESGNTLANDSLRDQRIQRTLDVNGLKNLSFKLSCTWIPAELISGSSDFRTLGIRLHKCRFA
jgi:MoaA/NifB/PqqE/SkfB family radical SAM enzyme